MSALIPYRKAGLVLFLLAAGAAVLLWWPSVPNPIYENKKLSEWIQGHHQGEVSRSKLRAVISQMGTNAVPILTRELRAREYWGQKQTRQYLAKQKLVRIRLVRPEARRLAAAQMCEALGPQAREAKGALVRALGDSNLSVRQAALRALGGLGSESFLIITNAVLAREHYYDAWEFLLRPEFSGEDLLPAILAAMQSPDPVIRRGATSALGRAFRDHEITFPLLIECLSDSDLHVRSSAIAGLGRQGRQAESAIPALEELWETSPELRIEILQALERIQPGNNPHRIQQLIPEMVASVINPNISWEARQRLALQLHQLDPNGEASRSIRILLDAFMGHKRALFAAGVDALFWTDWPPEIRASKLGQLLEYPENFWVRTAAADALREIGPKAETALGALQNALQDESPVVRAASAKALGSLGPGATPAIPALRGALEDSNRNVRLEASGALWQLEKNAERVLPHFISGMSQGRLAARIRAMELLAELGPEARPALHLLKELFEDANPTLSAKAAEAMGRINE